MLIVWKKRANFAIELCLELSCAILFCEEKEYKLMKIVCFKQVLILLCFFLYIVGNKRNNTIDNL